MSSRYKLLWLNGPLQGRELHLPLGSLSIGPDGDVLATLTQAEQIELHIDDLGVQLQTYVPAWVAGNALTTAGMLPLGQVIELAGVGFILGHTDDELQLQSMPKKRSANTERPNGLLIIAPLLLLALLITVLLMPAQQTDSAVNQTPAQWLEQQLTENDLTDISATWSTEGVVTLSGYCQDSQQLAPIINNLKSRGILFVEQTQCGDQLVSNVNDILSQNGFKNTLVTLGKKIGTVNISGAIQSGEKWDKTVAMLNTVPGLVSWQVSDQANNQIKPLINALRSKKLLEGIMVSQVRDAIVITGKVSLQQQQQVLQTAKPFDQSASGGLKIVFQNIPVNDELVKILTAPVVSFGGNSQSPFIELANGTRLSVGSKLSNGFVIEYLNIKGLDLSRDGTLIHIPLIF